MVERLKAVTRLVYPTPESLPIVRAAGGLSKLTAEQRKRVKLRRVGVGEFCDDLPEESREHRIARGDVMVVIPDYTPDYTEGD